MPSNPLHALAYVSRAASDLDPAHINTIVSEAAHFNSLRDVTGALVFDGACFFQYLEGPQAGIEEAYARIRASSSHVVLIIFSEGPARARRFDGWNMFYRDGEPSGIEQLNWITGRGPETPGFDRDLAMQSLRYFWGQFPEQGADTLALDEDVVV